MFKQIPLGPLQTNAYVLYNDQKEAVIFDPGGDGPALISWLKQQQLKPLAILLTHAHFDHIGAVDDVRDAFDCPVYIHQKEANWLENPTLNGSAFFPGENVTAKQANILLGNEKKLDIGPFTFTLRYTPGHSPGSTSYYYKPESVVFSGDALFQQGIGRTDLPGGNHTQLLESIHNQLLTCPEETVVASGHGALTTIGAEMANNPFLHGFPS
ncbi:MBL fold metallo-hydrolase [Shouchella lonarensis]|uniref:Glyoxylase, beta-lactamase superfamily II n=1 Tax=Shouchella lonarensis TaxID=1464122 RepID=A0A1G6GMY3_9BACI|nr:MBL fold metallo-hydrolase [Shouchella lonarensis]SDB83095.1 Glyoxylase, beta-lactamase superfamily II [Shouchella lonarensis]